MHLQNLLAACYTYYCADFYKLENKGNVKAVQLHAFGEIYYCMHDKFWSKAFYIALHNHNLQSNRTLNHSGDYA
mgnify:CR=1 FL=1